MSLDLLKIQHIGLAMRLDRNVDEFHYLKIRIITEQGLVYNLMIRTNSLIRFVSKIIGASTIGYY